MSDKMTCFLITGQFPFRAGEPFLEAEIEYLSSVFSKVVVFAIGINPRTTNVRDTPENVHAYAVGVITSSFRYIAYTIKGIFPDRYEFPQCGSTIKERLVSAYARGRCSVALGRIGKIINRYYAAEAAHAVYYSYWFTDHAMIAWQLRNTYAPYSRAVSRAHGYDLYAERNHAGYLPYQEVNAKELTSVYACSENGSEYLKDKYPIVKEKIHVARLGTKDHGVVERSLQSNEYVFLTCCNMVPVKRMRLFAEAFCALCRNDGPYRWVCIGDGIEMKHVKSIINRAGLARKVTFAGRLSNTEIYAYYKRTGIDYFCNVSSSEGVPVSIMEALSFGIPIIATDVGGTSELVGEANGFLIPEDVCADDLADTLLRAVSISNEQYQKKRYGARKVWEAVADADVNYSSWSKMLATGHL